MDKRTKILMMIWVMLAVASFVCAFYSPLLPKIVGIVFGVFNSAIILTYITSFISMVIAKVKNKPETKVDE